MTVFDNMSLWFFFYEGPAEFVNGFKFENILA